MNHRAEWLRRWSSYARCLAVSARSVHAVKSQRYTKRAFAVPWQTSCSISVTMSPKVSS